MKRRAHALAVLLLAACSGQGAGERAAAWLWSRQQPDGSFRSEQYAVLRSGQAMTPFVLHALLVSGGAPLQQLARALDSVRRSIGEEGAIGYADPELLEYPVYATAVAVLVLVRAGDRGDQARIGRMADWLAQQQCAEPRGFLPESPAYGAFGFGARGLGPGEPGHVDLAHTRFALQALSAAGRCDEAVRGPALVLLGRLQRGDGGFCFSPVVAAANKAGRDAGGQFRAYATATADGVLALQALGVAEQDPRVAAARAWLGQHASATRIGGIDDEPSEPWHDALRHYHAMVLAEAHAPAREGIAAMLAARQAADGSFRSELSTAMKEDDPLLATALALRALAVR
ncbi:MAG TPA: prenyltransferase/squalene oxidase repeat-containing protein [Planctomycetota bacterium]